jgi:hypothetical protein
MPTRNVNLTEHYDRFIDNSIAEGRSATPAKPCAPGFIYWNARRPSLKPCSHGSAAQSRTAPTRWSVAKA